MSCSPCLSSARRTHKASGMSPSALTVYPHLPPTTNILNSEQRTRLVRSTRKLGEVLGTTPYLLENDTSFAMLPIGRNTSRALKRQGSIFTHHQTSSSSITSISTTSSHHPSSSTSSFTLPRSLAPGMQSSEALPVNPPGLSTTRRCRMGSKAPPLYLRLNPVPVSPTDNYVPLSFSPTSCSSLPPSPVTPAIPDVAETRRKRMAKLARHLGEHIPAELVFASDSVPKPAPMSLRRRSQSLHGTHIEGMRVSNKKSYQQSKQEWVGEWNRSNIIDVQKELRNLRAR